MLTANGSYWPIAHFSCCPMVPLEQFDANSKLMGNAQQYVCELIAEIKRLKAAYEY